MEVVETNIDAKLFERKLSNCISKSSSLRVMIINIIYAVTYMPVKFYKAINLNF